MRKADNDLPTPGMNAEANTSDIATNLRGMYHTSNAATLEKPAAKKLIITRKTPRAGSKVTASSGSTFRNSRASQKNQLSSNRKARD